MSKTNPTAVMTAVVIALALAPTHAGTLTHAQALRGAEVALQPGLPAAVMAKASVFDAFHPRAGQGESRADRAGERHLRFDRSYQGVPVLGGDIIVHLGRDGQPTRVTTTLDKPIDLSSVVPAIDKRRARELAERLFAADGSMASSTAELMVVAVPSLVARPTLSWLVKVRGTRCGQPSWMHYFIDAVTGELHRQYEGQESVAPIACVKAGAVPAGAGGSANGRRVRSGASALAAATGAGNSLYGGAVSIDTDKISDTEYRLRDTTRGSHFVADFSDPNSPMSDADNTWGNGTVSDAATVAVDAAYGQARTWDYFKNEHSRTGIANDGAGYRSIVHFKEVDPGTGALQDSDNAFWDTDRMQYGDGAVMFKPMVSLDIAGHEMTHGITEKTAALIYHGESGALNESTSDIFGTMVEFHAGNAADPGDYLIGEKVIKIAGHTALRSMFKPSSDAGMFMDTSRDCWSTGLGSVDVHATSGIGNHFFYLLAEGSKPTGLPPSNVCKHNENTVASDTIPFKGMGRADAARIWYHALVNNMTSTTDYKGARLATLASAKSLFGDDSDEVRRVDYAWLAVNVTDIPKATTYTTNKSKATAQIVTPAPEVVLMGRRGVAGKSHWFAVYLDPGKSVEVNLTAANGTANYDLVGLDPTGKVQLAASKTAGGAKEAITVQNTGTLRKLFYITVPYVSGDAPYILRMKKP